MLKRLFQILIIVFALLMGIWLIYSYLTHLPSGDEIKKTKSR